MKHLGPTSRLMIGLSSLDLASSAAYLLLSSRLFGAIEGLSIPTLALLTLVRLFVVHRVVISLLGPAEQLIVSSSEGHAAKRSLREGNELVVADQKLQMAPLRVALLIASLWTVSALGLPALAWVGGNAGTPQFASTLLITVGVGIGLYCAAYPGTDAVVAVAAGTHSLMAREHQVDLRRRVRLISSRLMNIVVCISVASALVMAGVVAATGLRESEPSAWPLLPASLVVVVLIVAAGWAGGCSVLLVRSVLAPLEAATVATRRIAEQGDLSHVGSLPVPCQDEVGAIIQNVNDVLDALNRLARTANSIGNGNLEVEIQGQGELSEAFRIMLGRFKRVIQETWATSSELASAATEISAAAQELEVASSSQASGMVEIAQTMDSLSKSAAHVSDAVQGVAQNADRTLHNTEQMVSRIDSLSTHANRIGDILEVIREIANQSDLLALNGSLEATRVGEAGRGFALVAGEMRRLAERVTASVQDVKKLVADIRESGASTVVATEESKKLAEGTAGAARSITLVTQQQRSSTEQVNQSVRALSEIVEQAALATTQTRSSAEGLKVYADRLAQVVQTFHIAK